MTTTFTVLAEADTGDALPFGSNRRITRTRIDGDLADQVRAYYGRGGPVEIVQVGEEGGSSEYTVEWEWGAWLVIGDVFPRAVWPDLPPIDWSHTETSELAFEPGEGLEPRYGGPTRLAEHLVAIRDGKAPPR